VRGATGNDLSHTAVIAHRGDRSSGHENTIAAFQGAIALGADGVEFDVRRTADGVLIVHHDAAIAESVLAGMRYDAAVRLGETLGYQIPRLDDVLVKTRGRIQIDIELKEGGYEGEVLDMLARIGVATDEYVVTTFNMPALARVRQLAPDVRTGLLLEKTAWADALTRFELSTAQFLAPESSMIDQPGLAFAHEQRVPLVVWTVNDSEMMRQLFRAPAVIGVITDHPGDALRVRQETIHPD